MSTVPKEGLNAGFMQRVGFVLLAIAAAALAWHLMSLWLMIFGAIVIAVVLRAIAEPMMTWLKLPAPLAVFSAVVLVLALIVTTFYLFGREIVVQIQSLSAQLPAAWADLQTRLAGWGLSDDVKTQVNALGQQAGTVASRIPLIAGNVLSSVANFLVALIAGVILATNPGKYRDGVVFLFPDTYKPRLRDAMNVAGEALRKWFIGQLISMILVGSLTGIGLTLLGVPSGLALGMVSGLAQFVPIVGPVISAGPGLLLAGVAGWQTFLAALVIYVGVSQLEANIITPMVQNRIASVPMVVTLFAVVGFAGLMGAIGVLYAMPLTVVLYTLVMRFYKGEDVMEKAGDDGPPPPKPGKSADDAEKLEQPVRRRKRLDLD